MFDGDKLEHSQTVADVGFKKGNVATARAGNCSVGGEDDRVVEWITKLEQEMNL